MHEFWQWLLLVGSVVTTIVIPLLLPPVQRLIGGYLARSVDHHFDRRVEELKSELRQSEQRLEAALRSAEQRNRAIADTVLRLQSSRAEALTARRLRAVESLWKAKTAIDKWVPAAAMLSSFKEEALIQAAN